MKWSMLNENLLLYFGCNTWFCKYDWYCNDYVCNVKLMIELLLSYNIYEVLFIILALYFVMAWKFR